MRAFRLERKVFVLALASAAAVATAIAGTVAQAQDVRVQTRRAKIGKQGITVNLDVKDPKARDIDIVGLKHWSEAVGAAGAAAPKTEAVKMSPGRNPEITLPVGRAVVLRLPKPDSTDKPTQLTSKPRESSAVLVENRAIPGVGSAREIRQWTLLLQALQAPLPWNPKLKSYSTKLIVGFKDAGGGGSVGTNELSSPVTVQLFGSNVDVEPTRIVLKEGGVSGFKEVVISMHGRNVPASVTAISDLGEETFTIKAAPRLSALDLQPAITSIAGFGIGTTLLTVIRRAEDGLELMDDAPAVAAPVSLSVTGGQLLQVELPFQPHSSRCHTELRSAFLGEASILASVETVTAGPIKVQFVPPWSLFVAIALGAAIGAYLRVRQSKRRVTGNEMLTGFATGLILALGSFVGVTTLVQVPATAVLTEIGCFVVAAFEAYAGRLALDRFGGGGRRPGEPPDDDDGAGAGGSRRQSAGDVALAPGGSDIRATGARPAN